MSCEWTITKDYISDGADVGVVGPGRYIDAEIHQGGPTKRTSEEIAADPKARPFRMKDDDGELYYEGMIVADPGSEEDFAPLDDFGMPNAGCTSIEYRGKNGEWEAL